LDAAVLAHVLRTDVDAHRPLPGDTELAQAIAVLARAQQDAVWDRTQAHNKLRSVLREFYPAILAAFVDKRDGIMRPEGRAIMTAAPTPTAAARLTKTQLLALLKRAGRKRGIEAEAARPPGSGHGRGRRRGVRPRPSATHTPRTSSRTSSVSASRAL